MFYTRSDSTIVKNIFSLKSGLKVIKNVGMTKRFGEMMPVSCWVHSQNDLKIFVGRFVKVLEQFV